VAHDTTTFCRICEAQCGLTVRVDGDRITTVLPDQDHVVSFGYVCVKGLGFENVRASPDRLLHPLNKVDGRQRQYPRRRRPGRDRAHLRHGALQRPSRQRRAAGVTD
jgi:anaerobic selenocysteine-containing dehydrogenase